MTVRFFGGWDYASDDVHRPNFADIGYTKGVPMGGDLSKAPKGKLPNFIVQAAKDPDGANLDRVQVVKGWLDGNGKTHEKVYDVAWAGAKLRKRLTNGKLRPIGNTVDVGKATTPTQLVKWNWRQCGGIPILMQRSERFTTFA